MCRFDADLCIQLQARKSTRQMLQLIDWGILINLLTMNCLCPRLTATVTLIKNVVDCTPIVKAFHLLLRSISHFLIRVCS
jgi:hypothetical protein